MLLYLDRLSIVCQCPKTYVIGKSDSDRYQRPEEERGTSPSPTLTPHTPNLFSTGASTQPLTVCYVPESWRPSKNQVRDGLVTSLGEQTNTDPHLSTFLSTPPLTMLPQSHPPPLRDTYINIDSLAAALVKLNIKVSVEDLLRTIHDEDEVRRAKQAAERAQLDPAKHRAAMSKRKSITNPLHAP